MTAKAQSLAITQVRRAPDEIEANVRPLDFGIIRRLFSYTHAYPRKRNTLLVFALIRAIQLPTMAWAIGAVINGPVTERNFIGVLWAAAGFAALAGFTQLTFHYRIKLALELGEAVVHDLRNQIFQHLQRMPMSFYNRTKVGRVISRITSDAEAVRAGVQDVFFVTIVASGQIVVAALMMAWRDWVLFLVVAGMGPILWALNRRFRKRQSRISRDIQESFSRITATLAESVSGIRVTQGFVRQDVNAGIFRRLIADLSRYNEDMARTAGVFVPLLEVNSQFFIAMLLLLGGYRAFSPAIQMPVGDLISFFFLANIMFTPIQVLGNMYNQALTSMAGAERVFKLLDSAPEWSDPPGAAVLRPIQGQVEFRDVSFGYRTDLPVLRDINFIAKPGQTVALVGHTGSGKSSIINLIAKFYLPTAGVVLIDDIDLRTVQTDSLHRQMGIVQQSNFLFTGTVMENIRVGRPEATDEEVVDAVRTLGFLDVIGALPSGFATEVGERGSALSLGQRQLICFARAMLADPRILILDEATSSVDAMTEARIQKSLATLLRGRTSFVVAHRLSTIRHADMVLVLDRGVIAERGTHTQLLVAGGVYANLHRQFIQASAA